MIDNICRNEYLLCCDICGEEVPETFYDFQETVDYKKRNGWVNRKDDYDWYDMCPACAIKGSDLIWD